MHNPADLPDARVRAEGWPRRYTVVGLFFLATVLCYIDRVSISVAIIPLAGQEGYDSSAQGLILSAFFWGYLWPQLAGGWMADRFGGRRVLAAGVAIWSIATLATPVAAGASFAALLAVRVLLGLGEGVNFPSIHSLTARWMLPAERARALSLNFSGMYLGTVVAFLASPPIIVAFGWPALFYISGALGAAWVAVWMLSAADRPEDSAAISPEELELIASSRGAEARAVRVPWAAIAREKAVWAIVLAHFCSNFGFNILLLWLPTYLHHRFGMTLSRVGGYSLVPWIATFAVLNSGGWIADWMLLHGVSTGATRKTLQTIAFAVGAVPLLALPAISTPWAAIALLTLSAAANGLGLAAYGVNHLDVGPTYAGVLMGISNSIATLPGIIGVAAAGLILQATGSFTAVFYLIAAVYFVGMIGYLAWASGEQKL
jgi:MFS transporter, ACS family, solute carrier family 17 (sodium-dependent inorganic phosphate cotransporter), other